MEGGSTAGYFAIRMKSDVIYETHYNGSITQEKYCMRPGLYCGLILLTSIETGEPLAFINDGHLQHMRVGADGGIGVKYLAKQDAAVVGMLGSGGMARTHMRAFTLVRNIKKLQVFSPTRENREQFGREMARTYNIEVVVCDRPEDIYKGADIVAGLTDSAVPVIDGTLLEKGAHIVNVGGSGKPDEESLRRVDVYLRFGDTPAPVGRPELAIDDEFLGLEARPDRPKFGDGRRGSPPSRQRAAGQARHARRPRHRQSQRPHRQRCRSPIRSAAICRARNSSPSPARSTRRRRRAGLGREIPTEWFLQDIRD